MVEYAISIGVVVVLLTAGWKLLAGTLGRAAGSSGQRLQGQVADQLEARGGGDPGPPAVGFAGPGWGSLDAAASPNHRARPGRRQTDRAESQD